MDTFLLHVCFIMVHCSMLFSGSVVFSVGFAHGNAIMFCMQISDPILTALLPAHEKLG